MNLFRSRFAVGAIIVILAIPSAFAQKMKVGYDKGVDFAKYTTYTWLEPTRPPARPLLYLAIVGSVDYQLETKGLIRQEADGDLLIFPAGGIEYGLNQAGPTPMLPTFSGPLPALNATMWTGAAGYGTSFSAYVPEGTLVLTFIDRNAHKVIWAGSITDKLDMEKKKRSLERLDKAINKLFKNYPPVRR